MQRLFRFNGEETDVSLYKPARPLLYNDKLLSRYRLELKSSRWISEDSDELVIVNSEGMYGADIGDTIVCRLMNLIRSLCALSEYWGEYWIMRQLSG